MRTRFMIATAAAALLLAGAASAQPTGSTGSNFSQTPQPAGVTALTPPPAVTDQLPAPTGASTDAATVAPAAGAPAERSPSASAGTDVVSNGPVPDTRENRAKYGQPMSNAGRMTKPAGN
jgi:hypothetical protein